MSETKNVKNHKEKTEKQVTSVRRKIRERQNEELTANELMFRAWQKIYENRNNRLLWLQ